MSVCVLVTSAPVTCLTQNPVWTICHRGLTMQDTLTDLFKYLAIARRARGDMPGAKEALAKVESLGGSEGHEDVEELNRLMSGNAISVD